MTFSLHDFFAVFFFFFFFATVLPVEGLFIGSVGMAQSS